MGYRGKKYFDNVVLTRRDYHYYTCNICHCSGHPEDECPDNFSRISDGEYLEYYEDGSVFGKGNGKDGKQNGEWIYFHKNGQRMATGFWENGIQDGEWIYYREDGRMEKTETIKNGSNSNRLNVGVSDGSHFRTNY